MSENLRCLNAQPAPLSAGESARLLERETVIEKGFQSFVEVGIALSEIRDERLYRETHETFEEYCRERWGMSYRRAKQLMDVVDVVENLNNCSDLPRPTHESQIRPLTKLEPEEQREAWRKATETDPKPTARKVEQTVRTVLKPDEIKGPVYSW